MTRTLTLTTAMAFSLALVLFSGCQTAPRTEEDRAALERRAVSTKERFRESDPSLKTFFDTAHGYAVFPQITKGAIGIGGAHGRGVVFSGGEVVGFCDMTQGTIGLQLGGQGYSQIIFFQTQDALDRLIDGSLAFSANASAVAASAGAAATADYEAGVAVFSLPITGLMYEASIGGQRFRFEPR